MEPMMVSPSKQVLTVRSATVRFAGDSGDGMQLAGMRFTDTSAMVGNDIATLPDFPAEIRAPAGTVAGVSGFQVNFASQEIFTPGDQVDALIAMNPAAFKANISDVRGGGIVVVNEDEFDKTNLRKAGYAEGYNPLDDEKYLQKYKLYKVPITRLTSEELASSGMGAKDIGRCKNMYALGVVYYLYDRPLDVTVRYLEDYFGKKKNMPQVAEANVKALKAGYDFGDTAEIFPIRYQVDKAPIEAGMYRRITGNEALAMGLVAAGKLSGKQLIYCTYPITPASDILHYLAAMRHFGVKTFQAEDEIAAVCSAIAVSYAGQLGVTGTSGPGLALKAEAMGLAVITELPLIVIDVQRGGPSTGLPTKTEQSDLLQAMFGRNGDCPVIIFAPKSPADCFDMALEAVRTAFECMTPVMILSDGYIANGAEPWRIPNPDALPKIPVRHADESDRVDGVFRPYKRDANLSRPWAKPGTPNLQHRVGGLEKMNVTGSVCYDGQNHQLMTNIRREKVARLAKRLPKLSVEGESTGDLLVLGWGGTYGAITTAVARARAAGKKVAAAHLRYLNPFPANLKEVLASYKRVLIPELNTGQLRLLIRGKFLVDARGLNKIQGQPFLVEEIEEAIDLMLEGKYGDAEFMQPNQHHVDPNAQAIEQYLGESA
ncbi:MAG: 2-oxoacid:acceptor oxidoreductase subunit alpha [Planctomycetes bacterium]|nr:2-oxoacid:acceptor oxidoreductase subunit alpha [Planctomycetota bacterium]